MVLGIYGSGGLGREVLENARQVNSAFHRWNDIIFIDDYSNAEEINGVRVMSFSQIREFYARDEINISVAVGEPANRKQIYENVAREGYDFATIIHPTVLVPDCTEILPGTTICAFSFISCNVKIGFNSYIQPQTIVGHDCVLGSHVVISPCVALGGGCSIGEGTYIGMNTSVKEKTNIGSWSIIGMGSSVHQDVQANVIAIGNPARVIRSNEDQRVFR